ncbi:MAG: ABC transporter permease subunit [Thermoplasmata archaeon]|nr:ABC transporter permease subunit [Thermoplasmata archaeon]
MRRHVRYSILICMTIMIGLPIYALICNSFGTGFTYGQLIPESWSLDTLREVLDSPRFMDAFRNSIRLSLVVTVFTVILGFGVSKALGTVDFRGRRVMEIVLIMPAMMPGIALIFGLRDVMIWFDIEYTFESLILAELTFVLPYFIMLMMPVFRNYNLNYEYQAETLGVGWFNRLIHVTIPLVRNGLITATMYSFIVSWSMYLLTVYLADASFPTLPRVLFGLMSGAEGYDVAGMVAFFFIIPALIMFIVSTILMSRSDMSGNNV